MFTSANRFITAIQSEKREQDIRRSLTEFEKDKLKHVDVCEKNPLPDTSGGCPSKLTHNVIIQYAQLLDYMTVESSSTVAIPPLLY